MALAMPIMPLSQIRRASSAVVASPALRRVAASRACGQALRAPRSSQSAKSVGGGQGHGSWFLVTEPGSRAASCPRGQAGPTRYRGVGVFPYSRLRARPRPSTRDVDDRGPRACASRSATSRPCAASTSIRTAWRGVRIPRAERRRQVLDDADDRGCLAGLRRRAADPRPRPRDRRPGHPWPARRLPAGRHPRHRAQRLRQPVHLRPVLRHPRRRGPRAGRGAAGVRPAHREGEVARSRTCPAA